MLRATGIRSRSYVSSSASVAWPRNTMPSFHPRWYASWIPVFIPCAPNGPFTCAASPARNTLYRHTDGQEHVPGAEPLGHPHVVPPHRQPVHVENGHAAARERRRQPVTLDAGRDHLPQIGP